jgi:hypothetical protein
MVRFLRVSIAGDPTNAAFTYACSFWGTDVNQDINGQTFDIQFETPIDFTLGQMKSALSTAVQDYATTLGLVVLGTDIRIQSYETGI